MKETTQTEKKTNRQTQLLVCELLERIERDYLL